MKNYILLFTILFVSILHSQNSHDVFDIGRNGTVREVKEVLKINPKAFDVLNKDGYSPLILASYKSNNDVAKLLIESGCNINIKTAMGTPLMACVVKGNNEIAKILIQKNAAVNEVDANGTSAIIYCAMFKNYEIAALLMQAKANPEAKDNRNNSALDYAILADDDKLIQILKTK
jgi:ankyrin repeat protein